MYIKTERHDIYKRLAAELQPEDDMFLELRRITGSKALKPDNVHAYFPELGRVKPINYNRITWWALSEEGHKERTLSLQSCIRWTHRLGSVRV